MEKITRITDDGITYALFVHGKVETDSIRFLTQQEDALQVGVMERKAGYEVKPHVHPPVERHLTETPEFLYIEKGKVLVHVFNDDWKEVGSETLSAGDFLIFFRGGHGLTVLEPVRMLEVKQGPYPGDQMYKTFRN